jgi:hypothetical protein
MRPTMRRRAIDASDPKRERDAGKRCRKEARKSLRPPSPDMICIARRHGPMERGRSSGVEHNLAKVGVEGSNPFARSSEKPPEVAVFLVLSQN